jgi:hypothetical protein
VTPPRWLLIALNVALVAAIVLLVVFVATFEN